MLTSLENGLGLDIVIWFQQHANGLLDYLTELLDLAGGSLFLLMMGPVFYWATNKRLGQHILILLIAGTLAAAITKEIAQTPRPYVVHPDQVTPLFEEAGYGMPSAHTVNAVVFWFPVVIWFGWRRWSWALAGYVLLVMWSRLYAGVHYPQDTVVGLLIGLALAGLYCILVPARTTTESPPIRLESPGWPVLAILLAVPLTAIFWHYKDGLIVTGALSGTIIGMWIEARYLQFEAAAPLIMRGARYLSGALVLVALYVGLSAAFDPIGLEPVMRVVRYFLLTLFVVAGWPWAWPRVPALR